MLVLAINPGSTSTKIAVFDENQCRIIDKTVYHGTSETRLLDGVLAQKDMRMRYVLDTLKENGIAPESITAVVGRGGIIKPIDSGTYIVNEAMIRDLKSASALVHASTLGGIIAYDIAKIFGLPAYVVDPVVVDEMEPCAKLSGIPGIERRSVFHALNTKEVTRRAAKQLNIEYENGRFIVAHMGGGITVGAHMYGRVVDVNDAMAGEGPFTPERCGAIPVTGIIEMCYSGKTKEEMMRFVSGGGGMSAYLGTNDLREVEQMIKTQDEFAALVMDSMAYQVAKEIGAMSAVLEGRVNAIVLTGGLAHSNRFTGAIKRRVDLIAPVLVYPGEDEMLALSAGAIRVLKGEERAKEYK
ncbi:MAG TPA: butyrate kinase [Oscillospiraceae bacterium]|nr:butyrate kinase [Oscillospiraceae bacterium]HPK34896.1 butyrate kinase [Oscillospiraceae bacterium]HPR76904.1 butyrate kinase [Oscillospiraceae bacterium]